MENNIGFYGETTPMVLPFKGNKVITAFRESAVFNDENGFHIERQMTVEGKRFYVRSFFSSKVKATPTEQVIKFIDCGK